MDSSLMSKTDARTTLNADCDKLLNMCLDPTAHHDEVGRALLSIKAGEEKLKRSAEYWLLCIVATEIYRPHSAPRHVMRYLRHAYECADVTEFRALYAHRRVDALRSRTERSSASISPTLKDGYLRRLALAEMDLQEIGIKK